MPDWTLVGHRGHAVQFYENDAFLIELLSRYVGSALVTGDSAIVVVTPRHREALERRLRSRGFDVGVPLGQRRYIPLDTAATLAGFMRDGLPDPTLFNQIACPAIEDARAAASAGRGRVVAFGEMVALLWAAGNANATVRLEQLWDGFCKQESLPLFCAYPKAAFAGDAASESLAAICKVHSRLIAV